MREWTRFDHTPGWRQLASRTATLCRDTPCCPREHSTPGPAQPDGPQAREATSLPGFQVQKGSARISASASPHDFPSQSSLCPGRWMGPRKLCPHLTNLGRQGLLFMTAQDCATFELLSGKVATRGRNGHRALDHGDHICEDRDTTRAKRGARLT